MPHKLEDKYKIIYTYDIHIYTYTYAFSVLKWSAESASPHLMTQCSPDLFSWCTQKNCLLRMRF